MEYLDFLFDADINQMALGRKARKGVTIKECEEKHPVMLNLFSSIHYPSINKLKA
jgi:hypothetical protein